MYKDIFCTLFEWKQPKYESMKNYLGKFRWLYTSEYNC